MEKIYTKEAPSPIGPYSQAVKTDDLLFISGCLGINPRTNQLLNDIESQTKMALDNLLNILKADNLNMDNILKTTVYLKDMNDFSIFNKIYETYFKNDYYPARTCIEISALPKGGLIEIEAIASRR